MTHPGWLHDLGEEGGFRDSPPFFAVLSLRLKTTFWEGMAMTSYFWFKSLFEAGGNGAYSCHFFHLIEWNLSLRLGLV